MKHWGNFILDINNHSYSLLLCSQEKHFSYIWWRPISLKGFTFKHEDNETLIFFHLLLQVYMWDQCLAVWFDKNERKGSGERQQRLPAADAHQHFPWPQPKARGQSSRAWHSGALWKDQAWETEGPSLLVGVKESCKSRSFEKVALTSQVWQEKPLYNEHMGKTLRAQKRRESKGGSGSNCFPSLSFFVFFFFPHFNSWTFFFQGNTSKGGLV